MVTAGGKLETVTEICKKCGGTGDEWRDGNFLLPVEVIVGRHKELRRPACPHCKGMGKVIKSAGEKDE